MGGRRLHFIGIGGAGMSGLALVCQELGATVSGSDRADSSYMERLRAAGLEPVDRPRRGQPARRGRGVVSTAIDDDNPELRLARERGLDVRHRGELLAELCAEKRLIAIAGTHGKTTTTAMLVWALREIGADPAFFVGGEVPGLGPEGAVANAGWGGGEWVVAEADESDASFLELAPEIAVITNIEMDHHSRWGSMAELRAAFDRFAAGAERVADVSTPDVHRVRRDSGPLAVPGAHNVLNARAALAAAELAGFDTRRRRRRARRLSRRPPPARAQGRARRRSHIRRLRPSPDRGAGGARGAAGDDALAADRRLPAAPLLAHQGAWPSSSGRRWRWPTKSLVLDVYPAREQPVGELAGVSGLDVARAAADRMGGRRVFWTPTGSSRRRRRSKPRLEPGAVLVTIGAGDVFKRRRGAGRGRGRGMSAPPAGIERDFPLARLTTVRTGGAADWFARPERRRAARRAPRLGRRGGARASAWSAPARTCSSPTRVSAAWR